MGIDHIADILKRQTAREFIAHAHTTRVANTYQHHAKEAHEATQAKLPTLRVLSYMHNLPGAELEHIQSLETIDHIGIGIRASSRDVD